MTGFQPIQARAMAGHHEFTSPCSICCQLLDVHLLIAGQNATSCSISAQKPVTAAASNGTSSGTTKQVHMLQLRLQLPLLALNMYVLVLCGTSAYNIHSNHSDSMHLVNWVEIRMHG
jgi:hypothetical protein